MYRLLAFNSIHRFIRISTPRIFDSPLSLSFAPPPSFSRPRDFPHSPLPSCVNVKEDCDLSCSTFTLTKSNDPLLLLPRLLFLLLLLLPLLHCTEKHTVWIKRIIPGGNRYVSSCNTFALSSLTHSNWRLRRWAYLILTRKRVARDNILHA